MNRYGQAIDFSTINAPHIFSGICTDYSYDDRLSRQTQNTEAGDVRVLIQHSSMAELNFSAEITEATTDFLDLSAGASIAVTGITTGVVLASQAVERWVLEQPKTASVRATHFPDIVQASPVAAGALTAVTPDQSALTIMTPGAECIYGTFGLGHAAGTIWMMELIQQLTVKPDRPATDGKIKGATTNGYLRMINLDILALAAAPAKGSTLVLTGAPNHAQHYRIENVRTHFVPQAGKMFRVNTVWIPPFS